MNMTDAEKALLEVALRQPWPEASAVRAERGPPDLFEELVQTFVQVATAHAARDAIIARFAPQFWEAAEKEAAKR